MKESPVKIDVLLEPLLAETNADQAKRKQPVKARKPGAGDRSRRHDLRLQLFRVDLY